MKSPVSLAPYFKTDLKHRQCRLVRKRSGARKVGVRGGARNLRPLPVCSPLTLGGGGGLAGLPERTGAAAAGHVHGAQGEGRATVHCA